MPLETEMALLQKLDLFRSIDPVRLEVLAFTAERQVLAAGDTLFNAGETADAAYLIIDGSAVMLSEGLAGEREAVRLEPGELIGENALFEPHRRISTVRAGGPLTVLKISRELFTRLINEFPELASGVLGSAIGRLETLSASLLALKVRMAEDRLGRESQTEKET